MEVSGCEEHVYDGPGTHSSAQGGGCITSSIELELSGTHKDDNFVYQCDGSSATGQLPTHTCSEESELIDTKQLVKLYTWHHDA